MDFGAGDLNIVLNVTLRTVRRNLKFYLYETATLSRKVWKHRVHVFCTMQQFAMQTQFPLQDVLHFSFVYRDRSNAKRKLTILRGLFFAKVRIKERKIVLFFLVLGSAFYLAEDNENHSWERISWVPAVIFLACLWHPG